MLKKGVRSFKTRKHTLTFISYLWYTNLKNIQASRFQPPLVDHQSSPPLQKVEANTIRSPTTSGSTRGGRRRTPKVLGGRPALVENQHFVPYLTYNLVLLIMCPHTYVSINCYVLHIRITHTYTYTYTYTYMLCVYVKICVTKIAMWHYPFLKKYRTATFIDVKSVLKPEKHRFFKKQSRFLTTYK